MDMSPEQYARCAFDVTAIKQEPDMSPEQYARCAFDVAAIKQEPEMAAGQHTCSICDSITIKQEPVEADAQVSPKQEVEYISVKEEPLGLQEWEMPECHSSAQDPLSFTKEECSLSEDYIGPITYNIDKTENEEDEEEAASEDDGQECSLSEDYIGPITYNIDKTENEEDEEEAASEDDWQEFKNEIESISSEPEREKLRSGSYDSFPEIQSAVP
ncbi:neurofilament medium polypeptide-like isoform X16 [Schistocerca gregaria]|uniref:neurofilament medium polypeptide-like isoform X16 n=1 Tax=Schistocerca gregaria TaxID=7010 RepID=UPI00211DBD0F|nr:neurofilament medium polypeptide-like isoform X16 [Schistocerca gregaria]